MQITNNNESNPEGKSSVFENIIEFSNEANRLAFFSKGILNFKSKCPMPLETGFQEFFEGKLFYQGENPQPNRAALAQRWCYTLHGRYRMGRKHRAEGADKSRGWRKGEIKAYRIILWIPRCPSVYKTTVPPLARYRAQKYNLSVLCSSPLRPCSPEVKPFTKLRHTESFCSDHKEQACILC